MSDRPPKVFISYAHDDAAHGARVVELANRLRGDGFDCDIDQFHCSPPEGWPKWMDRSIAEAEFVLIVVTKRWHDRCMAKAPPDIGRGVRWESTNIFQHLYDAGAYNTKFIPVLFHPEDNAWKVTPLGGATHYLYDRQYRELLDRMDGVAPAAKAAIGTRVRMAPATRRAGLSPRTPDARFKSPARSNFADHDIHYNLDFVGRGDELRRLHERLGEGDVAITHAISGEGGIGKSQLAIRYAQTHLGDYDGVWWVDASNDGLEASLVQLAARIDPGLPATAKPDEVRACISSGLLEGKHLLILDSLEDFDRVEGIRVEAPSRTLITTRSRKLPPARVRDFPVDVLARAESISLLTQHRSDLAGREEHVEALDRAAEHLGDHALALTLCGKYLRDHPHRTPAELLAELRSADVGDRKSLFADLDPRELGTSYRLNVAQSLTLHLPRFAKTAGFKLLSAAAYCHPDDIPIELLGDSAGLDIGETEKWLRKLADVSIVEYGQTVSLHRLMQQAVRSQTAKRNRGSTVEALLAVLLRRFADSLDHRAWATQDRYAAHAVACIAHARDCDGASVGVLCNQVGLFFKKRARFGEGEALMRRALAIGEKSFGPDHPGVATALSNLAMLLKDTNRMSEAEPLMRRALAIDEKSRGPVHPGVATDLNNLALLLEDTNRMSEAEPLIRRALAISEKGLGPDHPFVATALSNLAMLLKNTNRMSEAEPLMRRALAIGEKSLGPDHPNVAIRLNNLALLLTETNRMSEAEPLMRRALAIDEKSLGPDHPNVAIRLNNLAILLRDTNRMSEAEPLMRRCVEIRRDFTRATGHEHRYMQRALADYLALLRGMKLGEKEIEKRMKGLAP